MMETAERILYDSLKDTRKHTESISCRTNRGKGFLNSFHNSQPVETLCEGHPQQQAHAWHAQQLLGMDTCTE